MLVGYVVFEYDQGMVRISCKGTLEKLDPDFLEKAKRKFGEEAIVPIKNPDSDQNPSLFPKVYLVKTTAETED